MPAALPDDLSRTRALFEQWRATRSSLHEKIPDELWQAVVALRDRYPVSQLCRELHWSAGALRARLREADEQSAAITTPEFVPLPGVLASLICCSWCRSYGFCWPSSRRISAKGWIL